MAAAHVAGGAAEKITPSYDRARTVANRGWTTTKDTFQPIYSQVVDGANQARERAAQHPKRRNRTPLLIGLLAAGAAVGAAGAMAARRRRMANQWDDYEPLTELESSYGRDRDQEGMTGKTKERVSKGVASVADTVSHGAGKVADTLRPSTPGPSAADQPADKMADLPDEAMNKKDR